MLWQRKHNSLGKQKCGISCRLIRMLELLDLKEDSNADEYLENLKAKLTFYLG
jgi:hypothetical protein